MNDKNGAVKKEINHKSTTDVLPLVEKKIESNFNELFKVWLS